MNGQTSSTHLSLVWSQPSTPDPTEVSEPVAEPAPESASVQRRRYTVTVREDGTELIDDMEEWTEWTTGK